MLPLITLAVLIGCVQSSLAGSHHGPRSAHSQRSPLTAASSKYHPKTGPGKHAALPPQQSGPLFEPIDIKAPPTSLFGSPVTSYPRPPVNADSNGAPIGTNKWYNQLLLPPAGTDPIFPLPYGVAYLNGTSTLSSGPLQLVGVGVMHSTAAQIVYSPDQSSNPAQAYANPMVINVALGAKELTASAVSAALSDFSELAAAFTLSPSGASSPTKSETQMRVQLSRGAAFVTAQYSGLIPTLRSALSIKSFTTVGTVQGFTKCRVTYSDDSTWLIYHAARSEGGPALTLTRQGSNDLVSGTPWSGIIQIARTSTKYTPGGHEDKIYDAGVGVWVVGATITSGSPGSGRYGFSWAVDGPRANKNVAPLVFGLPHHVETLTSATPAVKPIISLDSRTTGKMTLYNTKDWTFHEDVSIVSKFSADPINPTFGEQSPPTDDDLTVLRQYATQELTTDFTAEANVGSYYFGGKKLAKQALQCLTISKILKDANLTQQCVSKAKASFMSYVQMKTTAAPLKYETVWKGIISSAFLTGGDENADFGNGVYNDHHYHFGYFVHAAGVLAHLDPSFASQVSPFVQSLIRDVNNPSTKDDFFPFCRSFDWYAGHSWSSGLQSVADGKNEESTSEDVNFYYGVKVWAEATKQHNLAALADLQLAILHRSVNSYFLMTTDNKIQPAQFIQNRVTGILFENKISHQTFFSPAEEAIHMVQVLPVTPLTPFSRDFVFVKEEWVNSGPVAGSPPGSTKNEIEIAGLQRSNGYENLLFAQYAAVEPRLVAQSYKNTSRQTFLDDGQSLTWCLGFALSQLGRDE